MNGNVGRKNELIVRDRVSDEIIFNASRARSWLPVKRSCGEMDNVAVQQFRATAAPRSSLDQHQLKLRKSAQNCFAASNDTFNLPRVTPKTHNQSDDALISRAIKKEVVLLNGAWDTSNTIPNIVAEMHNVNIRTLQQQQHQGAFHVATPANKRNPSSFCSSSLGESAKACPAGEAIKENVVGASPGGSDSGIEGDCSDGNLSWLLNYRIHELPPVPDCGSGAETSSPAVTVDSQQCPLERADRGRTTRILQVGGDPSSGTAHFFDFGDVAPSTNGYYIHQQPSIVANGVTDERSSTLHKDNFGSKGQAQHRYVGLKKPPFTYTELIEHALKEKGELTVSGIYQWISDHFPFYKQNDDRWKNSVRHNLSINPHFRKGSKAVHGAGHLWTIAQRAEDNKSWNVRKQKMQQFMRASINNLRESQHDLELEAATASILPGNNPEDLNGSEITLLEQQSSCVNERGQSIPVEINYVNVVDIQNGLGDFLCPPVPKEQVVAECGLGGDYLITDLNPNALGLNLTDADIINNSNLYDELSFQCYEIANEQ